jgi:hypothetical protein
MKEKRSLSSSRNYSSRDSSFLDESFSLLHKQFVGESDCSSVESMPNESEHHGTMLWNIAEEVEDFNSIISEPIVFARGRDDLTPASRPLPTFSRQVFKSHDSALQTSFTATGGEHFNCE